MEAVGKDLTEKVKAKHRQEQKLLIQQLVSLRDRQKQEKAESRRELGFYLALSPARVRDMAEAHAKAREPLSWAFDEHGQRRDNVVPFPGPEKPLESFNEQAKGTKEGPEPEPPSPGPSKGRGRTRERTPTTGRSLNSGEPPRTNPLLSAASFSQS